MRSKLFLLKLTAVLFPLLGCSATGLYKPPGKGPFPAVVVLHSSTGIHPHTLDFASALSDEGYMTLVVDYLSAPRGEGRRPEVIEEELRIIREAYDRLKAEPSVDPDQIGIVGFSRGSNRALIFADAYPDEVKAVVNYFAGCWECGHIPYRDGKFPAVLFLHGDLDKIQPFMLEGRCSFLQSTGNVCEIHIYRDVGHAYLGGKNYDVFAATDSYNRTVAFLNKHVRRTAP